MMDDNALSSESCRFHLDYAYFHVVADTCLLLVILLAKSREFKGYLMSAHVFGMIAWIFDYGLFYLIQGKRTVDLIVDETDPSIEIADSTGPVENFLFFFWYDYLGAFLLIIWVRVAHDFWNHGITDPIRILTLVHQPLLFWTAPHIPSIYDKRVLLVNRPSPKFTYIIMLILGLVCLRYVFKKDPRKTFLVGFSVSCIHHLALFTNDMRGYTSITALMITLLTEWPALIVAEEIIRTALLDRPKLAKYARHALLIIFVALVSNHVQLEQIDRVLLPTLPGEYMQTFGTAAFRLTTCSVPTFLLPEPLPCRRTPEDNSILVIASPAKSGALLSAKILFDVGMSCHFCVASGERSHAGIPGPEESIPTYKGEMLHAIINMRDWGTYVGDQSYRCATILRDPIARLKSLYLYARAGGEAWFRRDSGLMQLLRVRNLTESLNLFWNHFGRDYIVQAHEYDRFNIENQNCDVYRLDEFKQNFDATTRRLLVQTWKLREDAAEILLKKLRRHDVTHSSSHMQRDPHVSSTNYSPEFISNVTRGLSQMKEVMNVVEEQRSVVPY